MSKSDKRLIELKITSLKVKDKFLVFESYIWPGFSIFKIRKEDHFLHQRPEPLILDYANFGSYRAKKKREKKSENYSKIIFIREAQS